MAPKRRPDPPPIEPTPRRGSTLLLAALLAFAVVAVFFRVRHHDYVDYDIGVYITANPYVLRGLTLDGLAWSFSLAGFAANWHPLTWMSHMLDVELFGVDPGMHHLENVAFHVANTVLVFVLFSRLTRRVWCAWLVAFLFGLHPMHVESVAWVVERKDVLSTFFGLMALWAYCEWVVRPRIALYLACCASFALGLMAKPMLVTFPCVMLLLDFWPLERRSVGLGRRLLEKLPLFALSAASCVATVIAQSKGGAMSSFDHVPFGDRIENAVVAYAAYLEKAFWPFDLAAFYPLRVSALPSWHVGLAALVLLAITAIAFRGRGRRPYLAFGWMWFLGTLVPVIGLVQVGSQSMADRYSYVPLIGVFVAVVWWAADLVASHPSWLPAARAGTLAVLGGVTALTWKQVGYWKDTRTLCEHALAVTRDNHVMHSMLGFCLLEGGEPQRAVDEFKAALAVESHDVYALDNLGVALLRLNRYDEAEASFRKVLEVQPDHGQAWNHLGGLYEARGDYAKAYEHMQKSVELQPEHAGARNNLGYILERLGRTQEAEAAYRRAIELRPRYARPLVRLGIVLADRGDFVGAERQFLLALDAQPDEFEAQRGLVRALLGQGKNREALARVDASLAARPDWPPALGDRAWILAISEDPTIRDVRRAVEVAEQAARANAGRDPSVIDALALSQAAAGRFDTALATATTALKRARDVADHALALRIARRIEAYREKRIDRAIPR